LPAEGEPTRGNSTLPQAGIALAVAYSDKTATVYFVDRKCKIWSWARVECHQKVSALAFALSPPGEIGQQEERDTLVMATRGGMVYSTRLPPAWRPGGEATPLLPEEPLLGRSTALSTACVSRASRSADQILFAADRVGVLLSAHASRLYRLLRLWPGAHEVRSCSGLGPSSCIAATDRGLSVFDPYVESHDGMTLCDSRWVREYFADVVVGREVLSLSFDPRNPMRAILRAYRKEDVMAGARPTPRGTHEPPDPAGPASPIGASHQGPAEAVFTTVIAAGDDCRAFTATRKPFCMLARRSICLPLRSGFFLVFWTARAYHVVNTGEDKWEAREVKFSFDSSKTGAPSGLAGPVSFYSSNELDVLEGLRVPTLAVHERKEPAEGTDGADTENNPRCR